MKKIPVSWPYLDFKEALAAKKVLKEGWLGMGTYVEEFEKKIQNYLNNKKKHVCCVSTGSDALLMCLLISNVKRNDEVILPSLNFIASAQAIKACGANPVFCDVDEKTLCIDIKKVRQLISKKTKAIISVDYSGNIANYKELNKIKKQYNHIRIIQDAAHSFGSCFRNKIVGTFSDIVMLSFDPIKTITSIDGGAIIVNNTFELKKLREIRQLGLSVQPNVAFLQNKKIDSDVKSLGFQNRMTNIHAAIGIEQIKKIKYIIKEKKKLSKNYNRLFNNNSNILIPNSDSNNMVPFIYYIRVDKRIRNDLRKYLQKNNIMTAIHWYPNHLYSFFNKDKRSSMNVTNKVAKELISIPYFVGLSKEKQLKICSLINSFFKKRAK